MRGRTAERGPISGSVGETPERGSKDRGGSRARRWKGVTEVSESHSCPDPRLPGGRRACPPPWRRADPTASPLERALPRLRCCTRRDTTRAASQSASANCTYRSQSQERFSQFRDNNEEDLASGRLPQSLDPISLSVEAGAGQRCNDCVYFAIRYIQCIYLSMYISIHVYMYTCEHVSMCICIHVYMYLCVYVYKCTCMYVYIYTSVHICTCICIHLYIDKGFKVH